MTDKKKKPKIEIRDLGPTAAMATFTYYEEEVEGMPDRLLPLFADSEVKEAQDEEG